MTDVPRGLAVVVVMVATAANLIAVLVLENRVLSALSIFVMTASVLGMLALLRADRPTPRGANR